MMADAAVSVIEIRAGRRRVLADLREGWRYRELFSFLIWRDIKVRYKQTALGAGWAILQPLLTMIVFSLFFGKLAGVPSDGVPYPLFALAGLVPWTFFAQGLAQSSNSLVASQTLVTKVYFPRLLVPSAVVLAGLADLLVASLVLVVMMWWYGVVPGLAAIAVPGFVALAVVASLGVGLWLSALNVRYRDVRYVVPFLTQMWLFATPIAYPTSLLESPWNFVFALNPLVPVVEGFRWALLGTHPPILAMTAAGSVSALLMLVTGALYFRHTERSFADII
jgi:lipopolysaccharide transport system permease protein